MAHTVSISENRVKAVSEKEFAVLKELERELGISAKMIEPGIVELEGDGGKCWIAEQILNAISLGFDPNKAFKLLGDDYFLETIDLDLLFGKNERLVERYKARVIGAEGRARRVLEELTDAHISIWENKVAILGTFEELSEAKEAIKRLLEGSTHAGVYAYLEKKRRENKRKEMLGK